mgnify:CR=1 FL=1
MHKILLAWVILSVPAILQASTVQTALSSAQVRGEAIFRVFGLPIYEARLYTEDGAALDWNKDFGIELNYLRDLTERDLVDSTLKEFERTGRPLPVREQLTGCFKDVSKGDQYLAVSSGEDQIGFWHNGVRVCTLRHPRIKQRFMAIFVGDNTRSSAFTRKLKGE